MVRLVSIRSPGSMGSGMAISNSMVKFPDRSGTCTPSPTTAEVLKSPRNAVRYLRSALE